MIAAKTYHIACLGLRSLPGAILAAATVGVILWTAPIAAQPAPVQGASPAAMPQEAAPAASPPAAPPEAVPLSAAEPGAPGGMSANEVKSPAQPVDALLPSSLPRDLSPWGMFVSAVPIVQAVMLALAFASLVTWTVWLAKTVELWSARKLARRGLEILASAPSLRAAEKQLAESPSPIARFATAAEGEAERSHGLATEGVKDRAAILLSRIEAQTGRTIARGTGTLATIGATAVFVGLFGTVWGIMDSFIGISKTNTTNLAVVAPGIAEALLATALGLVAAIPAVVMYNSFARSITGYRAQLGDAAAEVLRHLSR
ncbi:MAG: tonB-system energizer ExbB, partial [Beijerinckiaceae bacterium]|nr:tonB-system energizer ExbB [Beijerinckiaceae bacterium]